MEKPLHPYNEQARKQALKRAKQVAKMKNGGMSFVDIGAHFGFTRQRAKQLYDIATGLRNVE